MAKRENYNDLYLFMQVVREGSFTAAAQRLGLAQSGISRAVRKLEERLGVQLLVRTTRRLSLTQAGEQLYHNVESGFDALDMGLATLAHYRQTPSGTVRINASQHAIDKVLLPKDYLRLRMTGDFASDMSDAAGTMWLDVAKRDWSDVMLAACKLTRAHMPALYEGSEITGTLLPDVAKAWGMQEVAVVAGGGDNAAGAVGVGMMNAGQAMLSLGTSGVYFAVSDGFLSKTESAVPSFCHALPERWHLMSVMLSAASCLDWAAKLTGLASVPALIDAAQQADEHAEPVWFLPYLSGERTPHNNPQAKGVFFGLTHQHGPAELAQAVLEGVGFALADGMDVVHACGVQPASITLIGGGARSEYWRQMLSDISGLQLDYRTGGDVGPALGAARLAQIAMNPQRPLSDLLPQLTLEQAHYPDAERHALYLQRRETFRRIYQQLQPLMS